MKKGVRISLITFASIVIVVCVTALSLFGYAFNAHDEVEPTSFLSDWMATLKDDALLTDIVIPGSHDAGTKGMMWAAKTQDKSILEQLECGTRYFDIRVTLDNGELKIYHGPITGQYFDVVIEEIAQFISQHANEVLLLDFQHFDNGAKELVFPVIESALSDKIVSYNDTTPQDLISNLTLGDCRGKCIIFWGSESLPEGGENKVFVRDSDCDLRTGSVLHSPYTRENNTRVSKAFVEKSLPQYLEMLKSHEGGFLVLQGQLTDPVFIIGPRVLEATHNENMSKYIRSLENSEDLEYINIIMRDFVGARKNAEIIALNMAKGNVEDKTTFANEIVQLL